MLLTIISFLRIVIGKYGLLNIYSGVRLEPLYDFMLKIDGKNAIQAVNSEGVVDIYSRNIEKVVSVPNAVIENIDEEFDAIYSNSEMYYINKDGQIVSNKEVYPNNNIYAYNDNGKWGFKDRSGNIVLEAQYDFATDLNEYGFAGILLEGEWGVVNSNGEVIKQPSFVIDTYYLPTFVGEYLLEISDTYHCLELQ